MLQDVEDRRIKHSADLQALRQQLQEALAEVESCAEEAPFSESSKFAARASSTRVGGWSPNSGSDGVDLVGLNEFFVETLGEACYSGA